jgi:hypothetical protein
MSNMRSRNTAKGLTDSLGRSGRVEKEKRAVFMAETGDICSCMKALQQSWDDYIAIAIIIMTKNSISLYL